MATRSYYAGSKKDYKIIIGSNDNFKPGDVLSDERGVLYIYAQSKVHKLEYNWGGAGVPEHLLPAPNTGLRCVGSLYSVLDEMYEKATEYIPSDFDTALDKDGVPWMFGKNSMTSVDLEGEALTLTYTYEERRDKIEKLRPWKLLSTVVEE